MNKKSFRKRLLTALLLISVSIPLINTQSVNAAYGYSSTTESGKSNNRNYEWYMDQGLTGQYGGINCGPTSTAMVLKWLNPNSTHTGQSLRNQVPNNGDWWSTNIITNVLRNNGVYVNSNRYSEYYLLNSLKNGYIAIVCLDMRYISQSNANTKIGKSYGNEVSGHFIVVKGYKYINGTLHFEVYDPFSMRNYGSDGQPVGKDRLYSAREMTNAINNWWNTIYTVR